MGNSKKFEDKLERARELLEKLSKPDLPLEESMVYYKEGIKTLKQASEILENAKQELEILSNEKDE